MQGDVQRSKHKLRQAEERGVSRVISGMDDLTISTSIFKTHSMDRMEEVRGAFCTTLSALVIKDCKGISAVSSYSALA